MPAIFRNLRILAWLIPAGLALAIALALSLVFLSLGSFMYFSDRYELGRIDQVAQTADPQWQLVSLNLLDIERAVLVRAGSASFGRDVRTGDWLMAQGNAHSATRSRGDLLLAERVRTLSPPFPDLGSGLAQIAGATSAAVLIGVVILLIGAIFQQYLSAVLLAGIAALTAWMMLFVASMTGHIAQTILVGLPVIGLAGFFGLVIGIKMGPLNTLSMALARFTTVLLVLILMPTLSTQMQIDPFWALLAGVVLALIMPASIFVIVGTWLMAQGLGLSALGQIVLVAFNTLVVLSIWHISTPDETRVKTLREHRDKDGQIPIRHLLKGATS